MNIFTFKTNFPFNQIKYKKQAELNNIWHGTDAEKEKEAALIIQSIY